jgi:hypothetical protein
MNDIDFKNSSARASLCANASVLRQKRKQKVQRSFGCGPTYDGEVQK